MPVPYPAFFVGQLPAGGTIRTKDTEYGKEHDLYAANGRGFSRTLANSPLDCLCPAVARAGCSNPVTP